MARGKTVSVLGLSLSIFVALGSPAAATQEDYEDIEESVRVFNRAKSLRQERQYEGAIREYRAALKLDDQNPFIHNSLGLGLAAVGGFAESLKAFTKPVELNPDLTDAYNNMGMVYAEMGQKDKAFKAFTRAVRNPNYPTPEKALYNLGNLYLQDGNLELALMHFKRSVERQEKFTLGYRGLGNVYLQMGEIDEAYLQFGKALKIADDDMESLYQMARIHEHRGQLDQAREHYRKVVEVDRFSTFGQLAMSSLDSLKGS